MAHPSYDPFNEWQQKAMFALPIVPSLLSIVSSLFIIYIIWKDRLKKLRRVYHRIMLALSCADIINSIFLASSTIPIPRESPNFFGNVGTTFTCDFQGFVGSGLGLSVPFFNMSLCFYYLLTVVFAITEERFVKQWEPALYAVAIVIPITIATIALLFGAINPQTTGSQCFLGAAPFGCTRNKRLPCTRGGDLPVGFFYVVGVIILSIFVFVVVCTTAVYIVVRRQELRMISRYSFRGSHRQPTLGSARQVAIQAALYQGAFLLSFFFPLMTRQVPKTQFALSATSQILYPLQGFSNAFIYVRPRFNILRRKHPELPWWTIILAIPHETERAFSSRSIGVSSRGNRERRSGSILSSFRGNRERGSGSMLYSQSSATGEAIIGGHSQRGGEFRLGPTSQAPHSSKKSSSSSGITGGQLDSMIDDMELNADDSTVHRTTPPMEDDAEFIVAPPSHGDEEEEVKSEAKSVVELRAAVRTSETTTAPITSETMTAPRPAASSSDERDSGDEHRSSGSAGSPSNSSRSVLAGSSDDDAEVRIALLDAAQNGISEDDEEQVGSMPQGSGSHKDAELASIFVSGLRDSPKPTPMRGEDNLSRDSSESLDLMDLMDAMERVGSADDDDDDDMRRPSIARAQSSRRRLSARVNEDSSKYLGCVDIDVDNDDDDDDDNNLSIQQANEYRRMSASRSRRFGRSSSWLGQR